MKKQNSLFYFLFGIASVILIEPFLQCLSELLCQHMEIAKGKKTKKIIEINKEIEELQKEEEQCCTQAIGFEIPNSEDYYDDEDKVKNKIGF